MKAVFVVNAVGKWVCVDVVEGNAAANATLESYPDMQSYVVDLPAITR